MTALSFATDLTITALLRSPRTRDAVAEALTGERHLRCDARVQPLNGGDTILPDDRQADLLMVEVELDDDSQMRALEALIATRAGHQPIIVIAGETSLAGMRRLIHLGIADVVMLPLRRGDLLAAIASAQRGGGGGHGGGGHGGGGPGPRDDRPAARRGRVVSVLKACGGSGATTIAVHAASALARQAAQDHRATDGQRVGLIDLDLQFGSVALHLDLHPRLSVLDLVKAVDRLDGELLSNAATRHRSGLQVLPAPPEVVPLDSVPVAAAERLAACARATWAHTVIELPHAWTAWTRAVLAASDAVLLVTQMTVPGIHHSARQIDTLREENLGHLPLVIAVNRYEKGLFKDAMVKQAEQALGRPLEHFIPSDFKSVSQAIDAGASLHETRQGRKTLKRLDDLAAAVAAATAAPANAAE
ncbi:AAA family ATPase [Novispirillum sp. DQ9]|uniref:AAA family ATPase n=1 Tax=Novispirillum sp. DQ9 TaxID=3398612 RepID=UPI003C7A7DE6